MLFWSYKYTAYRTVNLVPNNYLLPIHSRILQQQYFPVIEANYQKFGFKRFRILPKVDKEQIEEDLKLVDVVVEILGIEDKIKKIFLNST